MATVLGNFGGGGTDHFLFQHLVTLLVLVSLFTKDINFQEEKNNLTVVWDGRVMAGSIGVGVGGGGYI